jgi:hypothetical protein
MTDEVPDRALELQRLYQQAIPDAEANEVEALLITALRLSEDVGRLCATLPVLPRSLALPASVTAVLQHGGAPQDVLLTQAGMMLWAIAFDDLWDVESQDPRVLDQVLRECRALASKRWRRVTPLHHVSRPLERFRESLVKRPHWRKVEPFWASEFLAFLEASRYEYDLARGSAHLSDDEDLLGAYLSHACHSIALPWLLIAGLGSRDDQSLVSSLPVLAALAVQCGRVARLSNDLGTQGRERLEGRVNAVTLLNAQLVGSRIAPDAAMGQVTQAIRSRLDSELAEARNLADSISTDTHVERRFLNVLALGMTLYSHSDFRALSQPGGDLASKAVDGPSESGNLSA